MAEFEGQGRLSRQQRRARERQERKQDRKNARLRHFASGAAFALGALMAPAAHGATITVNSLADTTTAADGQCTLREALANATSNGDTTAGDCAAGTIGDSIQFNPSLNGGTITLGGTELATTLVTGDLLTISGPGSSQLTIDANDASRALHIHNVNLYSPTAISGLTIINGSSGGDGGAIYSYGDLTLNDVTITGSSAALGGGVHIASGLLTIQNSTISGNSGAAVGARIVALTQYTSTNVNVTITGSTISNNSGSGVSFQGGTNLRVQNSTISGNTGSTLGGGVSFYGRSLLVQNTNISGNSATYGGGILSRFSAAGADATLIDSTLSGNTAGSVGGAAEIVGGGYFYYAPISTGTVLVTGTHIVGNTAGGPGGGLSLYLLDAATIRTSTISGNSAATSSTGVDGGGGGGIYIRGPQLVLENVTVANNFAVTGSGGGIVTAFVPGAAADIHNSTIAGNTAATAGGNLAVNANSVVALKHTIVADGVAPLNPDITTPGGSAVANYSLIENAGSATVTETNDLPPQNPQLGPLQNNGGATETMLPAATSAVINAGDPAFGSPPATDQRGLPRVAGGVIDIGAVESTPGTIALSAAAASVNEGAGSAPITVTRTGGVDPATVAYGTADGSATAPADYAITSGTLMFAANDNSSQTVNVPIVDDAVFEGDETFDFNLTSASPASALGTPATETITINDNGPPSFSIDKVTQLEGDSGTTAFTFTITKSGATLLDSTVQVAAAGGSATLLDNDYQPFAPVTLTFLPTDTTKTVMVDVNGDVKNEGDETFTVNLSSPANATISTGSGTGTGTIQNDDPSPSFSIDNVTLAEGDSGTTAFTFTITRSGTSDSNSVVQVATSDVSATTANNDYQPIAANAITFLPTDATMTVTVNVVGDAVNEPDETFHVDLTAVSNANIVTPFGTGTITNDDPPSFSIADVALAEGNAGTTAFVFTITKSGTSASGSSVQVSTADGTATLADNDYQALAPTTIAFLPTDTTKTVTVNVVGDTTNEAPETFAVNLSSITNAAITTPGATGTIQNDDGSPTFSITGMSQLEGDAGTTAFTFTITKSGATALDSSVQVATSDGTATVADNDYQTLAPTTITFLPADTSKTVTVNVVGDVKNELDETFNMNLSAVSNAAITPPAATGTIQNDDPPPVLSIDSISQPEGNGSTTIAFTITLTGSTDQAVLVNFATADGSATWPGDYMPTSGTLTFPPGTATQSISVTVNGDATDEPDESFTVTLSGATNATVGAATGTGTIVNDDAVVPAAVPALSESMLIALAALLVAIAAWKVRS